MRERADAADLRSRNLSPSALPPLGARSGDSSARTNNAGSKAPRELTSVMKQKKNGGEVQIALKKWGRGAVL